MYLCGPRKSERGEGSGVRAVSIGSWVHKVRLFQREISGSQDEVYFSREIMGSQNMTHFNGS